MLRASVVLVLELEVDAPERVDLLSATFGAGLLAGFGAGFAFGAGFGAGAALCGFGAGAGNVQLEALSALLIKEGYAINQNLYTMMDTSENIVKKIMNEDRALTDLSIISGMSGVFSSFKTQVLTAAKNFNVDPRDIFIELGKRKVVGGQEDMILTVAEQLSHPADKDVETYMLESLS